MTRLNNFKARLCVAFCLVIAGFTVAANKIASGISTVISEFGASDKRISIACDAVVTLLAICNGRYRCN